MPNEPHAPRPSSTLSQTLYAAVAAALLWCTACASPPPPDVTGSWHAVLQSPGGELPFGLEFEDVSGELRATIINGDARESTSGVVRDGRSVTVHFAWYDSEISAEWVDEGRLAGRWRRTSPGGRDTVMDFAAIRVDSASPPPRFAPPSDGTPGADTVVDVTGDWAAEFTDEEGIEVARAELVQDGTEVHGTFLTPTGDYRFLAGTYVQGHLRLSTFDGAHAFLFHARAREDGGLDGDFWSRDAYHATWTAERVADHTEVLPDAWQQVTLTNDEGRFRFAFPGLDGTTVSSDDPRFDSKVVIAVVFGTWCPNCNDEAPLLAAWHRRYADQGLEIVGLAFEFTGDPERDRRQLRRYAERHGITFPLLLAGTNDKKLAGAALPDLSAVLSYPTTVFIGRDGTVRKIHSGFAGPGTGDHHSALVAELEGLIRELLAESP